MQKKPYLCIFQLLLRFFFSGLKKRNQEWITPSTPLEFRRRPQDAYALLQLCDKNTESIFTWIHAVTLKG